MPAEKQTEPATRMQSDAGNCAWIPVHLHLCAHPLAPQAVASTDGRTIYLNVQGHRLSFSQWMRALAHEIAHLWQQNSGMVTPSRRLRGVAVNEDAWLEEHADSLVSQILPLLCAGYWPLQSASTLQREPVLQNLLRCRGKMVRSVDDLQPGAKALMSCIPQGNQWMQTIAQASTEYDFQNDLELLAGLQAGVHGSPLLLLRNLQLVVHPEALRGLSSDDLASIAQIETGQDDNSVVRMRVRRVLAAQQLLTESELKIANEFSAQMNMAEEPVFHSMDLSDRVDLFNLLNNASSEQEQDASLQAEASRFAVTHAANLPEFIDYYRFYMAEIREVGNDAQDAEKRMRTTETALDRLPEFCLDMLWVPTLNGTPSKSELPGIIAQREAAGFPLGFPRLSAALSFLAREVPLNGATGESAARIIQEQLQQLQNLWTSNVPGSVRVAQSGSERIYSYLTSSQRAGLSLSAEGILSIADCQLLPTTS